MDMNANRTRTRIFCDNTEHERKQRWIFREIVEHEHEFFVKCQIRTRVSSKLYWTPRTRRNTNTCIFCHPWHGQECETFICCWKLYRRYCISNLDFKLCRHINIFNPYWQILENSSRNFSKIFIFWVVTQAVLLENSSSFFFEI